MNNGSTKADPWAELKAWAEAHPEEMREWNRQLEETNRRNEREWLESHTGAPRWLREQIIEDHKFTCAYCARVGTFEKGPDGQSWHIDHILPLSRGGKTNRENLTLACASCNMSKNKMQPHEFKIWKAKRQPKG